MRHLKIYGIFALLLALAGCVSTGEVGRLDRDTYTVGVSTGNGAVSDSEMMLKAAQKASSFCAQKSMDMVRVDSTVDSHRGFGNRDVIFNFRCTAK